MKLSVIHDRSTSDLSQTHYFSVTFSLSVSPASMRTYLPSILLSTLAFTPTAAQHVFEFCDGRYTYSVGVDHGGSRSVIDRVRSLVCTLKTNGPG